MRHPSDGTLRRLLDEPAGVADADRLHIADCEVCLAALASAREDAAIARAALGEDPSADTDAAWQRLSGAVDRAQRPAAVPSAGRRRRALRSPLAAALGAAAILTGAGAAAAADWLQIFRAERVTPVALTEGDLVELPDLEAFGDLEVIDEPKVREVDDAAAAEARTGLQVPQVADLPRGVTGEPEFRVGDPVRAEFTFSADEAAQLAEDAGEALPPLPAGLDGSRFRLVAGPGLAAVFNDARGVPAMVVARAIAPTASSSGIPFATARDYMLSLPGLPEDVSAQLRGFAGDGTTLPIPFPAEEVESSSAEVDGAPATVFTARDGTMAGVVWVTEGKLTAVAGSLDADEVLAVARELRFGR